MKDSSFPDLLFFKEELLENDYSCRLQTHLAKKYSSLWLILSRVIRFENLNINASWDSSINRLIQTCSNFDLFSFFVWSSKTTL